MNLNRYVWVFMVIYILAVPSASSQTFGIGVDVPQATLDIRTTAQMSSLNIERTLSVSALFNPTILVNDSSDYGVVELYQLHTVNNAVMAYMQNDGTGLGLWVTNPDAANANPAAYFSKDGTGSGVAIYQAGTGDGISIYIDDFFNFEDGVEIVHEGNGYGLFVDAYNITDNILNYVETGTGVINFHFSDSDYSMVVDRGGNGFGGYDGEGYYFTNTDFAGSPSGADGYAFVGFTNTQTSYNTLTNEVYGAILAGEEYGDGHGVLINHYGSSGRVAEFNAQDDSNPDATIFATHTGVGSVIVAQNDDNTITGVTTVADISYLGTDNANHIAIAGYSVPRNGKGIGVYGDGGYVGVLGEEGSGSALAGIYATGDVGASGTKPFIIDHPEKPETHMLKHFAIESDKVLNMYQGNANLDRNGRAVITMPSWFDDINIDFSYQLTPIGTPVQPWVVHKIRNNRFMIAGEPNTEVSWVVFAKRNDAYIRTHPQKTKVELAKNAEDRGLYLDPESHGQPAEKGIFYKAKPQKQATGKLPDGEAEANRKAFLEKMHSRGDERAEPIQSISKPVSPERQPFQRMEIRQEIKTWDELR